MMLIGFSASRDIFCKIPIVAGHHHHRSNGELSDHHASFSSELPCSDIAHRASLPDFFNAAPLTAVMPASHTLLRTLQRGTSVPQRCLRRTATQLQIRHSSESNTPKSNLGASKPLPGTTPPPAAAREGPPSQAETHGAFRSQLYASTAARTAKERSERERHAHERQEWTGGRNMATTFGEWCCWLAV